jgi:hypothetical protein
MHARFQRFTRAVTQRQCEFLRQVLRKEPVRSARSNPQRELCAAAAPWQIKKSRAQLWLNDGICRIWVGVVREKSKNPFGGLDRIEVIGR